MWSNGDGYEALNKHYWQMKKDHIGGIEIETGFSVWDGYHGDYIVRFGREPLGLVIVRVRSHQIRHVESSHVNSFDLSHFD